MSQACDYKRGPVHVCGSFAFNLKSEGIDSKGLCDRHYWQVRWQRSTADKERMRVETNALRVALLNAEVEISRLKNQLLQGKLPPV